MRAAIIGPPTDMFYNTGISTYVWILSNNKPSVRKGKVQLIDATSFWQRMRKNLGSKRKELSEENIAHVTQLFGNFIESTDGRKPISKIFNNEDFGYFTLTVERPLRDPQGLVLRSEKGPKATLFLTLNFAIQKMCHSEKTQTRISSGRLYPTLPTHGSTIRRQRSAMRYRSTDTSTYLRPHAALQP